MSADVPPELQAGNWGDMWKEITQSSIFLQIFSEDMVANPAANVTPLLQLAYAIYLDKPLVILTRKGDLVPTHLAMAADAIVEYLPGDEESFRQAMDRVRDIIVRHSSV